MQPRVDPIILFETVEGIVRGGVLEGDGMEQDFDEFIAEVRARKIELGVTDADFDGFDNAGLQRTESKRRNLAALRLRALEAGVEPLPANF